MLTHPETELIPYLRNELAPADRERVGAHLTACAECRGAADAFRQLLHELGRGAPAAPGLDWGRYGAEVRARVDARAARGWWGRPVPLALSAGLAAVLLVLTLQSGLRQLGPHEELLAFEETVIGKRLDLLRQYRVVERLELLEDLDVIRQLDGLSSIREG